MDVNSCFLILKSGKLTFDEKTSGTLHGPCGMTDSGQLLFTKTNILYPEAVIMEELEYTNTDGLCFVADDELFNNTILNLPNVEVPAECNHSGFFMSRTIYYNVTLKHKELKALDGPLKMSVITGSSTVVNVNLINSTIKAFCVGSASTQGISLFFSEI